MDDTQTRAELTAALAAVTQRAELAEARDRLAQTLAAEDPALRAAADAEGNRAMRAAALATARREGAEAMRERCDAALDDEERKHRAAERDVKATLEERAAAWERGAAIESARAAIRALPLPGDATGGEP